MKWHVIIADGVACFSTVEAADEYACEILDEMAEGVDMGFAVEVVPVETCDC